MKVINTDSKWHGKKDGWSLTVELENGKSYEIFGFTYYKETLLAEDTILTFGFNINDYDRCFISELK